MYSIIYVLNLLLQMVIHYIGATDIIPSYCHSPEGYVVLESVRFPGHHVGILPDGDAKAADHTGTGEHARFTLIVKGGPIK